MTYGFILRIEFFFLVILTNLILDLLDEKKYLVVKVNFSLSV